MTNSIERALERVQQQANARNINIPELYEGDSIEVQEIILQFQDLLDPSISELLARGILAISEEFEQVTIKSRNRCVSELVEKLRGCSDERLVLSSIADFQEEIRKGANQQNNPFAFLWSWLPFGASH